MLTYDLFAVANVVVVVLPNFVSVAQSINHLCVSGMLSVSLW